MTAGHRTPTRIAVAVAALFCTLIALVGTPGSAAAAMRDHLTKCSEGPNGRACIHIETDSATGRIRARGAVDSFNGTPIWIDYVYLDRFIERTDGTNQYILGIAEDGPTIVTSTGPPASDYTGSVVEMCDGIDSRAIGYTVTWRATMAYFVGRQAGAPFYVLSTREDGGTC